MARTIVITVKDWVKYSPFAPIYMTVLLAKSLVANS